MGLENFFAELTTTRMLMPVEDAALIPAEEEDLEESKTYRWNGAQMSADVGLAMPIVYGRHVLAPNLINVFVEGGEYDTLNMLLAVCEGEIDSISNVKVGGNPIENYYGEAVNDPYGKFAEITIRKGTLDQTCIENFGDVHGLVAVDEALGRNVPYTYVTTKTDCECFNLEFQMDKMYQVDDSNNETAWYCAIRIEYREVGDTDWISYGVMEMRKNTRSPFKRYFKSEYLTPGQYEIRCTKVSEEQGSTTFGTVRLLTVDEITTQDLVYPGTALLGIRLVASEKIAGGFPNVTCLVNGMKVRVPDVKDGDGNEIAWEDYYWDEANDQFRLLGTDSGLIWDGVTYRTDFSANPAWCLRDLLLNERYGLGEYITTDNLDEASFLAAAKFCDEGVDNLEGNKEKRMRLDLVLDAKENALDAAYRICQTFRGLLHTSSGRVRLIVEKAEDAVQLFNMGNIVRDTFSLQYLSKKNVPNVLRLSYTNKDKNYQRDTIEVADETSIAAGEEVREQGIQFIGCTRASQALREGKIMLNKLKLNRTTVQFQAAWDAITCQVGDVIRFQHDVPEWGEGGRVQAGSSTTVVKLDKEVTLELGKTYEIQVRNHETDEVETREIQDSPGTYDELTVSPAFTFTPAEYDVWAFGEENVVTKLYRVTGLSMLPSGAVTISTVEYNENAYDTSGIVVPEDDYTYLTLEIPDVSNAVGEEQVTKLGDGTIDDIVNLSWTKPPTGSRWVKNVQKFEIYVSDDGGQSWTFLGDTDKEFYTARRPYSVGSVYTFAIVSVTDEGEAKVPSNSPQVSVPIQGWEKSPANVENFTYEFEEGIQFTWDKNTDENLAGYEIRKVNDLNWGVNDNELIWRGRAEKFYLERPSARQGIQYFIRAFNTSGKYSQQAATLTPINAAPTAVALTQALLFQKVMLMWADSTDPDLVEYEVWVNSSDEWTGEEIDDEKLYSKAIGTSIIVTIPYEPTYYRVRAVDKYGPGEWSNVVSGESAKLSSGDIGDGMIQGSHIADNQIIARHITAGQIRAAHIGASQITAEKIQVGELSAISANLGCITAGTIIGACIKTSDDARRTELNDAGLFGYNVDGCLTIKLASGELCLIDPTCSCNYSFLDHGALKFHHKWGQVPYLKRLCAGSACAGATVCLCGWYDRPEIIPGLRRLKSYDSGYSSECQEWCVYADNIRSYGDPASSSDFGWKFDVHAKLFLSGGTRDECVWMCNFDQIVNTETCVCELLVKELFQLACHGCSPDTWKYGRLCFEVRYRVWDCGVWCGCCYAYEQPHATVQQMMSSYVECQTIGSNVLTPSNCWDISLHQVCLEWGDSGISSGQYCCCLCCYQYTHDSSYWDTCTIVKSVSVWDVAEARTCVGFTSGAGAVSQCCHGGFSFGSWNCLSRPVCCSCVIMQFYIRQGYTLFYGSTGQSSNASDFGGSWSWGCSPGGYVSSVISNYLYVSGCSNCFVPYVNMYSNSYMYANNWAQYINGSWRYAGVRNDMYLCSACQILCYKKCVLECCWCCYWYCVWVGDAYCCDYKKLYSTTDTTEAGSVLDPNGLVNYLAVAYG